MEVIIGRAVNGISINGLEYLLDNEGNLRKFDSIDTAKEFLLNVGFKEEELEDFTYKEI